MNKSQSRFVFGFFALLLFSVFAGYQLYDYWQGHAYYRYDGACLKNKRGHVEFPEGNFFAARMNPLFWVRLPDSPQRPAKQDREAGVTVQFSKYNSSARQDIIAYGGQSLQFCETVPYKFDLIELVNTDDNKCILGSAFRQFKSTASDGPYAAVRGHCSLNPNVLRCRFRNYRPDGWVAEFSLSKNRLSSWKVALDATERFFDNKLIDCGDEW